MRPKTMLFVGLTVAAVAGGYALMEYSRGVKGADDLQVTATLNAEQLLAEFTTDEAAATAKYVGTTEQAVQVSGTIRSMEPSGAGKVTVVLETGDPLAGVTCEFAEADVPLEWRSGAAVTVKGICTGLLLDVVLVRCAPVV
jgi:hypothetical protein